VITLEIDGFTYDNRRESSDFMTLNTRLYALINLIIVVIIMTTRGRVDKK